MTTRTMPTVRRRRVHPAVLLVAGVVGLSGGWAAGAATLPTAPASSAVPALPPVEDEPVAPVLAAPVVVDDEDQAVEVERPVERPVVDEQEALPRVQVEREPVAAVPTTAPAPVVEEVPPVVPSTSPGTEAWQAFERGRELCDEQGGTWVPGPALSDAVCQPAEPSAGEDTGQDVTAP